MQYKKSLCPICEKVRKGTFNNVKGLADWTRHLPRYLPSMYTFQLLHVRTKFNSINQFQFLLLIQHRHKIKKSIINQENK